VTGPTRASVAGRAYLDLQNLGRREKRSTEELLALYALEGFLARLAASKRAGDLVLKGGALLAAYDARRPTRDVDLRRGRRRCGVDPGGRSVRRGPGHDGLRAGNGTATVPRRCQCR
jgi:hypothetical protein